MIGILKNKLRSTYFIDSKQDMSGYDATVPSRPIRYIFSFAEVLLMLTSIILLTPIE